MYIHFNGNPCGKNIGDCVIRAISIVTGYSRESRRGGYSRDEARIDFIEDARDLMRDAPDEHTRMKFQRFIDEIENA